MKTPAEIIIGLLGGKKAVAYICRTSLSSIYRWTYPKERGGTGGNIPSRHHIPLLIYSKSKGIPLKSAHFIQKPSVDYANGREFSHSLSESLDSRQ